jgi:phage shock protein A
MKTSKLITALILTTSIAFAAQPKQNDKTSKAKVYVDKFKSNILLADSQIIKLTKHREDYYTRVENALSIADENIRTNTLNEIQRVFQNAKDSLLTQEQRNTQKIKVETRKTALDKKYKK